MVYVEDGHITYCPNWDASESKNGAVDHFIGEMDIFKLELSWGNRLYGHPVDV